jgi:hypothetical protein
MESQEGARLQIKSIHCFDSMNEKSQIIQERLHSEERKEELQKSWERWQDSRKVWRNKDNTEK